MLCNQYSVQTFSPYRENNEKGLMILLAAQHSNRPSSITSSNYRFWEIEEYSDHTWGSPRGDSHINYIKNIFLSLKCLEKGFQIL